MGKKGGGGRVRVKQMGPKGMGAPINPMAELNSIAPEDQIVFAPRPDSNVTHIWPMSATFTLNYKEGFSSIWPTYLDSTKTTRHGRRIAAADAVPEPTVQDISEALQTLGIKHAIQPFKGLPADTKSRWDNPGRVLIDMEEAAEKIGSVGGDGAGTGASGAFDVDAVPDMDGVLGGGSGGEGNAKKALIRAVAKIIPTLPGRAQRLEAKKKQKEEEENKDKERAAKMVAVKTGGGGAGGGGGGGGSGAGGGSSKKKGKKKR